MLTLSYTLSGELKETLTHIDALRTTILTTPLSPQAEQRFLWEAQAHKITGSLALAGNSLSKHQVVKLLFAQKKRWTTEEKDVLTYKSALEWIREEWIASAKPISVSTVEDLALLVSPLSRESTHKGIIQAEKSLKHMLEYIQQPQSEHPVIQGGVALVYLSTLPPYQNDAGRCGRLLFTLFLAKYGYDLRGLLAPERQWLSERESYVKAIEKAQKDDNLNAWLLFVTTSVVSAMEQVQRDITASRFHIEFPASFWQLTDRQKTILAVLSEPGSSITNKKVQKKCNISQITASRDLTKLTSLGLLFPHGKGRSIYYTKV